MRKDSGGILLGRRQLSTSMRRMRRQSTYLESSNASLHSLFITPSLLDRESAMQGRDVEQHAKALVLEVGQVNYGRVLEGAE